MPLLTLKIVASLLQLHGPDATIRSDHQGIDALLGDISRQGLVENEANSSDEPVVTQAYFRRGGFVRGAPHGGAFRRGAVGPYGGFRRGGFVRGY